MMSTYNYCFYIVNSAWLDKIYSPNFPKSFRSSKMELAAQFRPENDTVLLKYVFPRHLQYLLY